MLLMLDNYDSFTFNLVQYFQQLGQQVVVRRNDQTSIVEINALQPDYIVISPGPKDPNQAGLSLEVIAHFAGVVPILGVCLGHQAIAQHFGASVIRADAPMHGKTSDISHNNVGVFQHLAQPLRVTRYHSLIVDAATLPACLEITASHTSPAGQQQIMGLRHKTLPIEGVQFHPESILTEQGLELLNNFLNQQR
ncbi:anthranilate synthase component II [Ferrimonas lipolytica]|uniref:Aminodeoxychorismate/anthranilate synthase component II n=1 Tax=Ferrimonas lipolytica TaxID=2724191 RepID=A0A6H1UFL1_9GAMM|nr:aminodeoxychorismate/anthranilate synthase component II [Ferrimonas lipolytica]QIZ77834.1 aminodeoxychorismate/anthranilate synthase component II [Ferrimonas lipolytica]